MTVVTHLSPKPGVVPQQPDKNPYIGRSQVGRYTTGDSFVPEAHSPLKSHTSRPPEMVHECRSMQDMWRLVKLYAPLPRSILLVGETGVGKGLVARWIHHLSGRTGDFVVVTGGSMSESLFQS